MKYRLTHPAEEDLRNISTYIASDNIAAALRFLDSIDVLLELLASSPKLGAIFNADKFPQLRCRTVPGFRNFIVFYEASADGILVIRVLLRLHLSNNVRSLASWSCINKPTNRYKLLLVITAGSNARG